MDLKEISQRISEATRIINPDDADLIRDLCSLIAQGMKEQAENVSASIIVDSNDAFAKSKSQEVPEDLRPTQSKSLKETSVEELLKMQEETKPEKPAQKAGARPKEEIIADLYKCVVEYEDEEVKDYAQEYIDAGYDPYEGIHEGLIAGMNKVSELYDDGEYFITDILLCSDAMYEGLDVIRPHLSQAEEGNGKKVVIGVVEGDTHDIGKNLVKIMMETAGFEMIDLGRDVPLNQFAEAAIETDADIVCMSTLMTTTMGGMERVVQHLEEAGIRDKVKVMIGGGCITQKFCDEIGADAYTPNAVEAVKKAKELVGVA